MRLLAVLLLCVIGLSASAAKIRTTSDPLPHDAYVWQRAWTPAVVDAVHRSADIVRSWRVLLAEGDRSGGWTSVAIPWHDLVAAGRPVVGVIRIDGRLDEGRMPALLDKVVATASAAMRSAGPAGLAGIEIDYDCPTSKLATYTTFLAALRERLPATVALSITALPTWLGSAALGALVTPLSEVVLQVHAVDDPRRGLFDPEQAERWVREFGQRVGRPFRVALPAYDVRVTWRPGGGLASVESEVPLLSGSGGELLDSRPPVLRQFLEALDRSAPTDLVGIVWFRLPVSTDRRAWSLETWRAVIAGRPTAGHAQALLVPSGHPDLWNVVLANDGAVDVGLPRRIPLDPSCKMADGANGFRLVSEKIDGRDGLVLEGAGRGRLKSWTRRTIGWARCAGPERQLHVVE